MKDKWMNIGFEGDELTPYLEPESDFNDEGRIGKSFWDVCSGTSRNGLPCNMLSPK